MSTQGASRSVAKSSSGNSSRWIFALVGLAVAVVGGLLLWWSLQQEMDTTYGRRSGVFGTYSVNGTRVLSSFFERAGHTVRSKDYLSPKVATQSDVIVWFPDDFALPSEQVIDWFDGWLCEAPGRTLIYVGRDFDAAPSYWRQIVGQAPASQQAEIRARGAAARSEYIARRSLLPSSDECDWFELKDDGKVRSIASLDGRQRWLAGVDASKVDITLRSRLAPPPGAQVLLSGDGLPLVSRQSWCDGQIIVVTNGSFLLNMQLVNREHRKLAASLVCEVPEDQRVTFLQTDASGLEIFDKDPEAALSSLEILSVPPFRYIFLHLAAAGLLLSFLLFPIFGRPRAPSAGQPSDFGKHVVALGKLLSRTGDEQFAMQRLRHYRQTTRVQAAETPQASRPAEPVASTVSQSADSPPASEHE